MKKIGLLFLVFFICKVSLAQEIDTAIIYYDKIQKKNSKLLQKYVVYIDGNKRAVEIFGDKEDLLSTYIFDGTKAYQLLSYPGNEMAYEITKDNKTFNELFLEVPYSTKFIEDKVLGKYCRVYDISPQVKACFWSELLFKKEVSLDMAGVEEGYDIIATDLQLNVPILVQQFSIPEKARLFKKQEEVKIATDFIGKRVNEMQAIVDGEDFLDAESQELISPLGNVTLKIGILLFGVALVGGGMWFLKK